MNELFRFAHDFIVYDDGDSQIFASEFDILTRRISIGLQNSSLDLNSTVLHYLPPRLDFLFFWALVRMGVRSGGYNLAAESLELGEVSIITPFREFNRSKHETWYLTQKVLFEMTQLNEDDYVGDNHKQAELVVQHRGASGEARAVWINFAQEYENLLRSGKEDLANSEHDMSLLGPSTRSGIQKRILDMANSRAHLTPSDPKKVGGLIDKYRISKLLVTPNQLGDLARTRASPLLFSDLKIIEVAGGLANRKPIEKLGRGFEVRTTLVSPELGKITALDGQAMDYGNVGTVIDGFELEVVDENNGTVETGTTGRVRFRNSNLTYSRRKLIGDGVCDGWLYSGDRGYLNSRGQLTLVEMGDETRYVDGFLLSLAYVEKVLSDVSQLKEIAAFFYEDENHFTQLGVACVPTSSFDLQSLMLEMRWRLGTRAPSRVLRIDKLPRSAHGEILREELAEKYGSDDLPGQPS